MISHRVYLPFHSSNLKIGRNTPSLRYSGKIVSSSLLVKIVFHRGGCRRKININRPDQLPKAAQFMERVLL
jgi:hypothetical protein